MPICFEGASTLTASRRLTSAADGFDSAWRCATRCGRLSGQRGCDAGRPDGNATAVRQRRLTEIVVTGIRASLQKSLDIKRDADGIVDAISAEDIGKFPDSNLADRHGESSRRDGEPRSGLADRHRRDLDRAAAPTQITVRGFGPQFNETLFDGRQVPTAIGNATRGFDFGSVGSDFVGQVDVLKTPDATLSSGAIGATVNIKYPKPFDHPGLQLAGSLSGDRLDRREQDHAERRPVVQRHLRG